MVSTTRWSVEISKMTYTHTHRVVKILTDGGGFLCKTNQQNHDDDGDDDDDDDNQLLLMGTH